MRVCVNLPVSRFALLQKPAHEGPALLSMDGPESWAGGGSDQGFTDCITLEDTLKGLQNGETCFALPCLLALLINTNMFSVRLSITTFRCE